MTIKVIKSNQQRIWELEEEADKIIRRDKKALQDQEELERRLVRERWKREKEVIARSYKRSTWRLGKSPGSYR